MGLAIAAMWFCGLSSVTSASRTMYAFSRDGGLPFSAAIARVSPRTRTPVVAIGVATVGPLLLVLGTAPFAASLFDAGEKVAAKERLVERLDAVRPEALDAPHRHVRLDAVSPEARFGDAFGVGARVECAPDRPQHAGANDGDRRHGHGRHGG